ncbi:MAG: Tex-like N-terminal domain-containing protein, partial [Planctomycetia bacterium]|nr:Tex-like N-terminal domain-containing protein [Planctomycetia bacterium]
MTESVVFNCGFLARELKLTPEQVQKVIDLLEKGMPVPYIAHYQKDEADDLSEEKIRAIAGKYAHIKAMFERKQSILRNLQNDQKLTPELERSILDARTERRLEDIYLAYKPRKQTEADFAREKGLEPLALSILQATEAFDIEKEAALLVDPAKELPDTESVLKGVAAILSEKFAWNVELRQRIREHIRRFGLFVSKKIEDPAANSNTSKSAEEDQCKSGVPENAENPVNAAAEVNAESGESQITEAPSAENADAENTEVKGDDPAVSSTAEPEEKAAPEPEAALDGASDEKSESVKS